MRIEKYLVRETFQTPQANESNFNYLKTLYTMIDKAQEESMSYRMSILLKHFTKDDLKELDIISKLLKDASSKSYDLIKSYYQRLEDNKQS